MAWHHSTAARRPVQCSSAVQCVPKNRLSAAPRARGVAALHHEVLDDAVEERAVVVPHARQLQEVLAGARRVLGVQLHLEGPLRAVATTDSH